MDVPQAYKGNVLLVDDDEEDLDHHAAILEQEGYQVNALASFEEAATSVEHADFDLIIVAQGSRAFEGRDVLARLAEREKRPPVLVLTKNADVECYMEAVQLGALEYLEKPLAPSHLAFIVSHYLPPGRART